MDNQWNRIVICAGTLLAAAWLATPAVAAEAGSGEAVETSTVPTRLIDGPREDEPDGTCAACTVDHLTLDYEESAATVATLDLYFEDNGEDEVADIDILVLLSNDDYRVVTIPGVELVSGEHHIFELSPGIDWDWHEVRYAWVEVDSI